MHWNKTLLLRFWSTFTKEGGSAPEAQWGTKFTKSLIFILWGVGILYHLVNVEILCSGLQCRSAGWMDRGAAAAAGGNRTCGAASWEAAWWTSTDCHLEDGWVCGPALPYLHPGMSVWCSFVLQMHLSIYYVCSVCILDVCICMFYIVIFIFPNVYFSIYIVSRGGNMRLIKQVCEYCHVATVCIHNKCWLKIFLWILVLVQIQQRDEESIQIQKSNECCNNVLK